MLKRSGFTLIELLVVIAIIGLLSSVVITSLSSSRIKARDARRLADMKNITTALELYRDEFGVYPTGEKEVGTPPAGCWGWDTSTVDLNGDGYPFISPLATSGIMSVVPTDPAPVPGGDCDLVPVYKYARYTPGANGCPVNRGGYYVLMANRMETLPSVNDIHPLSQGFKCGTGDWSTSGQYVTGGFEN